MQNIYVNGVLRELDKMAVVGEENDLRLLRQFRHDVERRPGSIIVEVHQGVIDEQRKRLALQ